MNENGAIYPYTALFAVFFLGVCTSFLNMYVTEVALFQEMQQIETLQSLVGMTVHYIEESPVQSERKTYHYNEGIVHVNVLAGKEEKTLFQLQCITKKGATYTWELWYDRTNHTWNRY
ncbi:ComG operon protein 7 (ComGG) [Bacillus oleivorans]|uniref:ComG operon protein 7 (ComGG) n=1 Tax=Bacillus oleivorans TaxID=1448271 RepID=A0A285CK33_9BACI|nr:competence type IV pilus minor pilin ComGG [Bacillus oleivorans]SNX67941.1 ComG operon protein 7 (ComGG) [Bacillus oleivorans]